MPGELHVQVMFTNLFSEDLFDDDEPEPIPGDPHSAHQLILHESLHPSDDEPFWTNFLARAKARLGPRVGHLPQVEDDADKCDELERRIELASSTDTKSLWVVVVTVGLLPFVTFLVAHLLSLAMRNMLSFVFTNV